MKKIFVIDDNLDILEVVQLILTEEGFETIGETSAKNLIEKIKASHPDVILLDVLLSGYDGRLICQELKNDPDTKHIPVVMMSAHPSAKETIYKSGANGFVAKPFAIIDLLSEIKKNIPG